MLKNFYNMLSCVLGNVRTTVTKNDGTEVTIASSAKVDSFIKIWSEDFGFGVPSMHNVVKTSSGNDGIILGSGNKAYDFNDYWLSGEQITTFNFTTPTVTNTLNSDGTVTGTSFFTVINTGAEAFTVGEIGLRSASTTGSSSSSNKLLIDRRPLPTPVTVEPNGVAQIEYTITIPNLATLNAPT